MVNGLIRIPASSNAYFASFTGGFFYLGENMFTFIFRVITILEIAYLVHRIHMYNKQKQEEEQCNSSTQEPQQNSSDTP